MKLLEKGVSTAAVIAALSTLACCVPLGFLGALGLASLSARAQPLRPWLVGASGVLLECKAAWRYGLVQRRVIFCDSRTVDASTASLPLECKVPAKRNQLKWRRLTHHEDHGNPEISETFVAFQTDVLIPLQAVGRLAGKTSGSGWNLLTGAKIFAGGPLTGAPQCPVPVLIHEKNCK